MTADYETMKLTRDGRLLRVELTRPERLNAFAMTGTARTAGCGAVHRRRR